MPRLRAQVVLLLNAVLAAWTATDTPLPSGGEAEAYDDILHLQEYYPDPPPPLPLDIEGEEHRPNEEELLLPGSLPLPAADQCEPGLWSFKTTSSCPPGHTLCGTPSTRPWESECVLDGDLCDGVPDCACGWDEQRNCTACHNGAVLCREEAKCVRAEWRCDGTRDCADGEDEAGCPADGSTTYLGVRYDADMKYACGPVDNVTRWAFTVCDGVPDCPDASDETMDVHAWGCAARLEKRTRHRWYQDCAPGSVLCSFGSAARAACLPSKKVCDGWPDCANSDMDERDCLRLAVDGTTTTTLPGADPSGQHHLHVVKVALVFLCVVCSAALAFAVVAKWLSWRHSYFPGGAV